MRDSHDQLNERFIHEQKHIEENHNESREWFNTVRAKTDSIEIQVAALKKQLGLLDERVK